MFLWTWMKAASADRLAAADGRRFNSCGLLATKPRNNLPAMIIQLALKNKLFHL
jgi:hypothetical protein